MNRDPLLTFPCQFPIKVIGRAEHDFDSLVVQIIRQHADFHEGAVSSRGSRGGAWQSVTVTINAQSQEQLDRIYQALVDHESVHMAL
jgi:putative lipoic acid-binding regulatory protein